MLNRIGKVSKVFVALLVVVACVLPVFYFGVYRVSDYVICRAKVSQRVNHEGSHLSVEEYISNHLVPGSSRGDVKAVLQKLGEIKVVSLGSINSITSEQINLKMCSHPLNNLVIFVNYSNDGQLTSIKFLDD